MSILTAAVNTNDITVGAEGAYNGSATTTGLNIGEYFYIGEVNTLFPLPKFSLQSEIWISGFIYFAQYGNAASRTIWEIRDDSDVPIFRMQLASSGGLFDIDSYNGSTWSTAGTATVGWRQSTWMRLDIRINMHATTGNFELYVDGKLVLEITGDTIPGSVTQMAELLLGSCQSANTNSSTYRTSWAGIFVASADTRGQELWVAHPNGAGNYTAWTGAYTDVDQVGIDDAGFLTIDSTGQRETVTCENLPATTGWDPVALMVAARVKKSDPAADDIQLTCRSGTTDGDSAAIATNDAAYGAAQAVFANDPDTASAWASVSAMQSAEVGVYS